MKNDFISSLTLRTMAEKLRKELEGETMHPNFLDAMRYAYDCHMKEKEKETMNDCTWIVKSTVIDRGSPYSSPEITVELSGIIGRETKVNEVIEDLRRRVGDPGYSKSREDYGKCYFFQNAHGLEIYTTMRRPEIKNVIFNDPATIVFWADGTKTVVKCQEGDEFDPEKGLTMAIVKKVYGNKGSYCNVIKKWVEPYYEKQVENKPDTERMKTLFGEAVKKYYDALKERTKGFVKITEHYGYVCLFSIDSAPEYYVIHKDELDNISDKDSRDWLLHSPNRNYAVSMAHHLEYHHYISKGL